LVGIACGVLPPAASAQRSWLEAGPHRGVTVRATSGVFDDQVSRHPIAVVSLEFRQPLGTGLHFVAALAGAHAEQRSGVAGSSIGNPWIGIEYRVGHGSIIELGAWPGLWSPTDQASALPWVYGHLLEFDRREAWLPRTSSLRAAVEVTVMRVGGWFATTRLGVSGSVPRGQGVDGELVANYAVRMGHASRSTRVWAALLGRGLITESGIGLGDRTTHQVELAAVVRRGGVEGELAVRREVGEPFAGNVPLIVRAGATIRY
jgi:hypothetical protein